MLIQEFSTFPVWLAVATSEPLTPLGPECGKYRLTSPDILAGDIKEIPIVTNQLIIELLKLKDATPNCSYKMLLNWLQMVDGSRWPHENSPTLAAVTNTIECLKAQHFILKKKRDCKAKQVNR